MLDGGPSRMSQANDRRAAYRQSANRRPVEAPQAPTPQAVPASGTESQQTNLPRKPRGVWLAAIALGVLVLLAAAAWLVMSGASGGKLAYIDDSRHQAVFLTNGDRFFGKVDGTSGEHVRLTEVFFIESTAVDDESSDQSSQSEENITRLIPLVEQSMYAPEDEMIINRDQVLFILNLKTDSRVSELIREYNSSN